MYAEGVSESRCAPGAPGRAEGGGHGGRLEPPMYAEGVSESRCAPGAPGRAEGGGMGGAWSPPCMRRA